MKVAFYKGRTRLFDKAVQWWTRAPYSHCELVFSSDVAGLSECASSSFIDHGVRVKGIVLDPAKWDVIDVPWADPQAARARVHASFGRRYDLLGLLGFVWPFRDNRSRLFCSEAVAEWLGLEDPWRYSPGGLAAMLRSMAAKPASVPVNDDDF